MNDALDRYCAFLESIRDHVPACLEALVREDVHFRDPFNDVHGRAHYRAVIDDMVHQVRGLEIVVTHAVIAAPRKRGAAPCALLRWRLGGRLPALANLAWQVEGTSEALFDEDGRLAAHYDYWDAAGGLYERMPLLGGLLRQVRRRLAVAAPG